MRLYCSVFLSAAVVVITASAPAAAGIINFDDIDATAVDVILDALSPYQGFTWTNATVYISTPGIPGFNNGIVSAPNGADAAGDVLESLIISRISLRQQSQKGELALPI